MRLWVVAVLLLALVLLPLTVGADVINDSSFEYGSGSSFSANWTKSENGIEVDRHTGWATDGIYAAEFSAYAMCSCEPPGQCMIAGGGEADLSQTIDLTGVDKIIFDARLKIDESHSGGDLSSWSVSMDMFIELDSVTVWSESRSDGDYDVTFSNIEIDTSTRTGTYLLTIKGSGIASAGCDMCGEDPDPPCDGEFEYSVNGRFDNFRVVYGGTPTPTNLQYTKGTYWINHTWDAGSGSIATDSYNVSIDEIWHNGTTDTYYNNPLSAYGDWSNITVYAWNNTDGLSEGAVSEDVQLIMWIPATPIGGAGVWDFFWVNHTWTNGTPYQYGGITDSYNISITTHWINGTQKSEWHNDSTDTFYNNSLGDLHGQSNIVVYAWNDTGGINETAIYQSVEITKYTPPQPTNAQYTSGWYWVNHTWATGTGYSTDSFNISAALNLDNGSSSQQWINDSSPLFYDHELGSSGWSNLTIYAWNDTHGGLSDTALASNRYVESCPRPHAPVSLHNRTGYYWVNRTWGLDYEAGGAVDGWNISVNEVWHNTTDVIERYNYIYDDYEDQSMANWTSGWVIYGGGSSSAYSMRSGFSAYASGDRTTYTDLTLNELSRCSFDYKTVGRNNQDHLKFFMDDELLLEVTGDHDWTTYRHSMDVPPGDHCFKFVYHRDSYPMAHYQAWIDNFKVERRVAGQYLDNLGGAAWSNITVWSWNTTYGMGDSVGDNIYMEYIPHSPINLRNTSGWYWVHHTWDSNDGVGATDSYNVSIDSAWHNGTTDTFWNDTTPTDWGQWSNITVWAWNGSHASMSAEKLTDDVVVPAPELIDWFNNATNNTGTIFEVWINTTVYFNCTSEATIPTWTWTGEDTSAGTTSSITTSAEKFFGAEGTYTVSVVGANAFGETETKQWTVQVYDPQAWRYPEYYCRKPVPISNPCGSHSSFFIPIHINTTGCLWSDCRDLLFYDPIVRTELPYYTNNDLGYVEISGNELVYVQVPHALPEGDSLIHMYFCNPNETSVQCVGTGRLEYDYWFYEEDVYVGKDDWQREYDWVFTGSSGTDGDLVLLGGGGGQHVNQWYALSIVGNCPGGAWYMNHKFLYQPTSDYFTADWSVMTSSTGQLSGVYSWCVAHGFTLGGGAFKKNFPIGTGGYWQMTGKSGSPSAGVYCPVLGVTYCGCYGMHGTRRTYVQYFAITQETGCIPSADAGEDTYRPDPGVVFTDAKGNQLTNVWVAIDDLNTEEPVRWQHDHDGVIYFTDGITHLMNIAVRTHEGVFIKEMQIPADEIAVFEVPITYNIDVRAFDEGGRQLDETICTLSEYTVRDPGFFWGIAISNRTSIRMKDLSSFGRCDMTVEKAGYAQYNVTGLNWTTQSTMVKDYKHDAILTTE